MENLTKDEAAGTLKALIALCHAQDMAVVGEGVDTEAKLTMLKAAGCDLFQGYLISKPLSVDDLKIWALKHSAALLSGHSDAAAFPKLKTAHRS